MSTVGVALKPVDVPLFVYTDSGKLNRYLIILPAASVIVHWSVGTSVKLVGHAGRQKAKAEDTGSAFFMPEAHRTHSS